MNSTNTVVHLPPRLFMGVCLAAALAIAVAARSGATIPAWLLPVEVGATILSLFLLGSFTYQLEKDALTYGMSLVMFATYAGSAWAQQGLQGVFSTAELRGWLEVLQAAPAALQALALRGPRLGIEGRRMRFLELDLLARAGLQAQPTDADAVLATLRM